MPSNSAIEILRPILDMAVTKGIDATAYELRDHVNTLQLIGASLGNSRFALDVRNIVEKQFDIHAEWLLGEYLALVSPSSAPDFAEAFSQAIPTLRVKILSAVGEQALYRGDRESFERWNDTYKSRATSVIGRGRQKMFAVGNQRQPNTIHQTHNYSGNIGSIQVGNNNIANVTNSYGDVDEQVIAELRSIIQLLRKTVHEDVSLDAKELERRNNSLAVLEHEVEKTVPSRYTLGGLALGIATWAQGMAAAPAAGDALRGLATALLGA